MDYFNEISCTIEYIEENLKSNITVEDISRHIHISKYHFQRLFKCIVGDSLISYIKKRKLSEALILLKNSNLGILDIAIELGFNSNESFTRAFKNLFGLTPKDYRNSKKNLKFYKKADILERKMLIKSVGCLISWEIAELSELKVAGLQCIAHNSKNISNVWDELIKYSKQMDSIINSDLHYNIFSSNDNEQLEIYFGGFNIKNFDSVPSKFVLRKIKAQKYAKFIHEAENETEKCQKTKHLNETINLIYDTWLPNTDYEIADVGFDRIIVSDEKTLMNPNKNSIIEIYIPLK